MKMESSVAFAPLLEGSELGAKVAEEIALETSAVKAGVERYKELAARAINKGEGASLKPIERIMLHWYSPLRLAIRAKQRQVKLEGGVVFSDLLNSLSADAIAVITMHETLSQCVRETDGVVPSKLYYAIGNAVQAEVNLHRLVKVDQEVKAELPKDMKRKDVAKALKEKGGDADSLQMSARRMTPQRVNRWARDKFDDAAVNRVVCTHLGRYLFFALLDIATRNDYDAPFELAFHFENDGEKRRGGKQKASKIILDEELVAMIDDGHEARAAMRPRYLPMVMPPLPWVEKGDVPGGYLCIRTPFISKPTPEQTSALKAANLTEIYGCLTDASATPWRVNDRVLAVQEAVWESGGGDLGIPLREDPPKPPKPEGYNADAPRGHRWDKVPTDIEKAWRREAVEQHRAARKLKSDRKTCGNRIGIAKQFAGETIYFPHQLDFRTRGYPIPLYLNHQGDDVCRGLLEFAEAKPCDSDEAWEWLHVHAANCYGYDKLPFHERTAWTVSVEAQIRQTAADPLNMIGWWGMAEKPWQFLAACFAIVYPDAAARIPIQKDGVCNGLQQYAAMLRDPRAAAAVSMIPSDRPGDVYTTVAGVTVDRIAADADSGNPTAKRLLGLVGRGVVKQTVMTTVYGVTVIGARDQLRDRLAEKGLKGQELYDASKYLQGVVFESIGTVCESATKAMAWIQECASLIAKKGELVRWTTELGFPVVQPYRRGKTIRVRCKSLRLIIKDGRVVDSKSKDQKPKGAVHCHGGKVRVARHRNSAAPNFVHSVDASHMLMTARACAKAGVTFAAVHDSFWTHAATIGQLDRILREQFVALHTEPLLNKLRKQWLRQYPGIDFPPAPEVGDYDVNSVLTSTYFFS